jgi:dolichol-phosphate mannosyltransferase
MTDANRKVPEIWVILPTYCEADNLPQLVERLNATGQNLHILVVDDNSPDGTADVADHLGERFGNVSVLRRDAKEGLGAAYLAGFAHACSRGAQVFVTMDSDLSHQPETLPQMLDLISDHGCVIGSRYVEGGDIVNWPKRRKVLSAAANRFVRSLFGMPVNDCTSGYRVYRREVIEDILRLQPRSQGYSFLVEALRIALTGPLRVTEVPITFIERIAGKSKMGLKEIVDGVKTLSLLRLRLFSGKQQ